MRKNKDIFGILCLLMFISACATISPTVKPWREMTPKEKSHFFISMYSVQYDDTMAMAKSEGLTDSQKMIVAKKKEILSLAWPLIRGYDDMVVRGQVPSVLDERKIMDLLNRLTMLGG